MSPSRNKNFCKYVKDIIKKPKKLKPYVRYRWDYTYEMLCETLQFKDVIHEYCVLHVEEYI